MITFVCLEWLSQLLLSGGAAITDVQHLPGHASVKTTWKEIKQMNTGSQSAGDDSYLVGAAR